MRFGTIDGRFVLVDGSAAVDVARAHGDARLADPLTALSRWDEVRAWAAGPQFAAAQDADDHGDPGSGVLRAVTDLGPPVPSPRQVFAVALNYRPHAAEAGYQAPTSPLIFTKFPSCITGPDARVRLPAGKVDWEIEVVAIIGTGGRDIAPSQAWGAVAGLTVGQDLSERVLQSAGTPAQFSLGKSHAGFGPVGPVGVTTDEFPDRDDIGFESTLDGRPLQHGRTSEMIFAIPELVGRLSAVCELFPGDLIFTGTPAGVGHRLSPPRYLQPGETLVSRVEHIGAIRQQFLA